MIHLLDRAGMERALTLSLEPDLHALLKVHIDHLTAGDHDLTDWTEILIVQPGDTEADIVRHVGFSPLVEPIDGIRFPDPQFQPHWDWLAQHDGGWFEMTCTFGSTFAYVLLIQDAEGGLPSLLAMCRQYVD
ncbi:hypothetical protein [Sphingomonas desiccabilis]|uniref:Uncharacterized protein n=1 Tax=Sphingomonas desiccabilis TaxID=429134 RepID=A0A4Q2IZ04_9SPHN|nr:hypothetical protein [Sphingomonas desiccabilis]MBB3909728.1 hypothetical protein [Sphingomonas desiccabilis]RXZ34421.1 hypothetical protein EO081_01645 [Sphingomonas desiccabilis]